MKTRCSSDLGAKWTRLSSRVSGKSNVLSKQDGFCLLCNKQSISSLTLDICALLYRFLRISRTIEAANTKDTRH